ncbi:unnamed protein product [Cunninghamella blakesleeana]
MEIVKYKNSMITKVQCLFTFFNDIIILYDFIQAEKMKAFYQQYNENRLILNEIYDTKYSTIGLVSAIRLTWALGLSMIVLIALFFTKHKHWVQHVFIFRIIYLYFLNEEITLSKLTIGLNVLNALAQTAFSLVFVYGMFLGIILQVAHFTIAEQMLNVLSLMTNSIIIIFACMDAHSSRKGYKLLVKNSPLKWKVNQKRKISTCIITNMAKKSQDIKNIKKNNEIKTVDDHKSALRIKSKNDKMNIYQLQLYVKPGARQSQVMNIDEDAVHVQIAAPSREGEANKEVVNFISSILQIPKSTVYLVSGFKSRLKKIEFSLDQTVNVFDKLKPK